MSESIADLFKRIHSDSRVKPHGLERRKFALIQLRKMIEENEDQILEALEKDLGKPRFEAYSSEVYFVLKEISYAVRKLKKWMCPKRVGAGILNFPAKAYIHQRAKGVVLIISPWNYPFQLLFAPVVGALAAGNRVVLKPSEVAAATSNLSAALIKKYFPDEVISVVEGGVEATTELLKLPFDHIFYTGNGMVGRIVMEAAAKNLTPVTLELGGKSPAVVWGNNDFEKVAKRLVWGKTLNSAQTCVAPDYVLLHPKQREPFVAALKEQIDFMNKGSGGAKIINERHFDRLENLLSAADYEPLLSGQRDRDGLKFGLQVIKAQENSLCMKDEIFGPILPVIEVNSFDEALKFIGKRDRPLAAYIFSSDKEYVERFKASVVCGGMCVRDTIMQLTSESLPFGGIGPSGMGHYHGHFSFELFSHPMSVLERHYHLDLPVRYPPYGKLASFTMKILRFLSKF